MSEFVLVTGATGRQGGAVARALLDAGVPVHALVRDPGAPRAADLAARGATLVRGDLDDPESLVAAFDGARSVFSVQMPDLEDLLGDREMRHARNTAAAAAKAGVGQIVHTSVSGAGGTEPVDEERFGAHMAHYWRSKAAAEQAVRDAGVERWTILRPATFMENFVRPSFYFADGTSDRLLVVTDPDAPQPFVATEDIGSAGAAAVLAPERFDRVELELAGEMLSFREAARTLSEVWGGEITLPASVEQAREWGAPEHYLVSQQFVTEHPQPARPEFARALGLPTTPFATWASRAV
ncbi:NmrA/HSCARG family protein [Actinomycetospora aeridis]|uniref:NmrA/HSCARG family protein n=1 Tax=Actinomycetospora aeridis TaxID=3129231 RepID=A0ABU8NBS8_9PSEU